MKSLIMSLVFLFSVGSFAAEKCVQKRVKQMKTQFGEGYLTNVRYSAFKNTLIAKAIDPKLAYAIVISFAYTVVESDLEILGYEVINPTNCERINSEGLMSTPAN